MTIQIHAPDNSIVEFPDGTPDDTIRSAMAKAYPPPEPHRSGDASAAVGAGLVGGIPLVGPLIKGGVERAAAGVRSLQNGSSYADELQNVQAFDRGLTTDHPIASTAGQIGGGVLAGAGLAGAGLSAGANAIKAGSGLARVALGSATDGAILGGAQGFGEGDGLGDRIKGGVSGGLIGGGLGLAAPLIAAGAATAAKPLIAPFMARINPENYANAALGEGLKRSGKSIDDVVNALSAARADGQNVFTTADAMGNAGQRLLSTAARNPNDARQAVVEALQSRQAGQGRRIANALSEGFAAPDTAAQRAATLTATRTSMADEGYDAAREAAGAVNVSPAIERIDSVLRPGVNRVVNPGSNIANDTVEGALVRARSLLTDGKSNITDFSSVMRAKQDIDDQIGRAVRAGANNQARLLLGVKNDLEAALESASQPYAAARNNFRQTSQQIDAVDTGRQAAMRGRPKDTIDAFRNMPNPERNAFRAGYADPLIERVQTAAVGANKARPLINDATAAEFPAFAAPGQGPRLGSRLARENLMFETNQTALGGSKTADNLADATEMAKFDPGVMTHLFQGRPVQAVVSAVSKALNESRGMPPRVIEKVARAMMETDPDAARQLLNVANSKVMSDNGRRAAVNAVLTSLGATAGARLSVP